MTVRKFLAKKRASTALTAVSLAFLAALLFGAQEQEGPHRRHVSTCQQRAAIHGQALCRARTTTFQTDLLPRFIVPEMLSGLSKRGKSIKDISW